MRYEGHARAKDEEEAAGLPRKWSHKHAGHRADLQCCEPIRPACIRECRVRWDAVKQCRNCPDDGRCDSGEEPEQKGIRDDVGVISGRGQLVEEYEYPTDDASGRQAEKNC
ncbi:hypothetical protein GCM10027188_29050 [Lysobacter humi (ex Lee et al. 2017)]